MEKPQILIVDDTPSNIQLMNSILKEEYTLIAATSAFQALELLDRGLRPDLILLDVVMPNMDGYELCQAIKSKEQLKRIPIIFVTILENERDIVQGFKLGAVDYIIKPIEPVVVKARVKTHINLKKYQDQLIEDLQTKEELIYNQSKLALLGEMFENITHQWKQPLSTISIMTSGMQLEKEYGTLSDETIEHGLDTIDDSVHYLSQTVDDFRNFLSNDTKKHNFNVKEILEKTLKLLDTKFKNDAITIQTDVCESKLNNYQNELIQVMMNILANARDALVRYTTTNRTIMVTSEKQEEAIIVRVCDNAGGIKQENINKIFEKYFTTKETKEGNGIGLYMSKKIIEERLNGKLKAYNTETGACFEITLPL